MKVYGIYKKWCFWLIIIFIVISMIFLFSNTKDYSDSVQTSCEEWAKENNKLDLKNCGELVGEWVIDYGKCAYACYPKCNTTKNCPRLDCLEEPCSKYKCIDRKCKIVK